MKKESVFINCPFDNDYKPLLQTLLFAIRYFQLEPLISSLESNTDENRLSKIETMIKSSQYSIHDLSRMKSTKADEYYRMNMPFELGMDYGMSGTQKKFLIFESEHHGIVPALSDINGWDIVWHKSDAQTLLIQFRKWIVANDPNIDEELKEKYSEDIWFAYNAFQKNWNEYKKEHHCRESEISVKEYVGQIDNYLRKSNKNETTGY